MYKIMILQCKCFQMTAYEQAKVPVLSNDLLFEYFAKKN